MLIYDEPTQKSTYRICQLPEFEEAGYAPAFEHMLPARHLTDTESRDLPSWIRCFMAARSDALHDLFGKRWLAQRDGPCERLIQYLMEYEPYSIITWLADSWLLCRRPASNQFSPMMFLIGEPVEENEIDTRLMKQGIHDDILSEMLTVICGLRESVPPPSGTFIDIQIDWNSLRFYQTDCCDDANEARDWMGALQLFQSMSGESLFYHRDGRFAWLGAERSFCLFASNSLEFVEKYSSFIIEGNGSRGYPFDPYSSESAVRNVMRPA
ncbi:MAG: hypothetical protein U0872_01810 [Planctomycetaceae bacterium]